MSHNKYKLSEDSLEQERLDNEVFLKECIRVEGLLLKRSKYLKPILEEEATVSEAKEEFTAIVPPHMNKNIMPINSVGKLNMSFT